MPHTVLIKQYLDALAAMRHGGTKAAVQAAAQPLVALGYELSPRKLRERLA